MNHVDLPLTDSQYSQLLYVVGDTESSVRENRSDLSILPRKLETCTLLRLTKIKPVKNFPSISLASLHHLRFICTI